MSNTFYFVLSHLWESTLFGVVCALLILTLGKSWSYSRHFLAWASILKFLVPFAVLAPVFSTIRVKSLGDSAAGNPDVGYLEVTADLLQIESWWGTPASEELAGAASPWEQVLVGIWLVGFVALAIRLVGQYVTTRRTLRRNCVFACEDWQRVARRVWERNPNILPKVLVCENGSITAGVFGLWRPIVMIPSSFENQFDEGECEAFLRHEFQHVYKRDTLWLFVQKLIRNLFWMHPLVWWLDRQICAEREILRDEEVIRKTDNITSYLNCLMKASNIKLPRSYATTIGIKGSPFTKRVKAIARIKSARFADYISAAGSVLAVLALTLFLSASLSFSQLRAGESSAKDENLHNSGKTDVSLEPKLTKAEQAKVKEVLTVLEQEGDKEAALDLILEAITEDSTAAFEFIAGNFYAEKDELEKAIDFYGVSAEKHPPFLRAIRNKAILEVKIGRFEEAKKDFLSVVRLGADDTTTYGLLGLSYVNLEDYDSAEHYYRIAIDRDPSVADWKIGLAKSLSQQGKRAEGDAIVSEMADAYRAEGKDAEADALMEGVEPSMPEMKVNLGSSGNKSNSD